MKRKNPSMNRNPLVLPMTLHTKHQTFHDKRDERGGAKNEQAEYLEAAETEKIVECTGLIVGTFIACGEGDNYCSDECWSRAKELEKKNEE